MFALADINKFFANSIRVFMPHLIGKPVMVLSNNDGCNICATPEAQALGIKMGDNFFEVEHIVKRHGIVVFSTNFPLFADMSLRTKSLIRRSYPKIEDYSIDEVFIGLGAGTSKNHIETCSEIKKMIGKGIGLPISIGIAPTLTLTKVACKYAKNYKNYNGICIIDTDEKREKALKLLPVGSVWGIGHAHEEKLKNIGVKSAYDFTMVPLQWVRKHMTITGEKTWRELKGVPCIEMITEEPDKKSITVSRSFGRNIESYESLASALTSYSCMAAAKLRNQKSVCKEILVFIDTNRFREDMPQYGRNILIKLPVATNFDLEITQYVLNGLRKIFKNGYGYKKAGVILMDISDEYVIQNNVFDTIDRPKFKRVTYSVDYLNKKYGRNTIVIATQGFEGDWHMKQERLCPCFTTRPSDFPVAI